MTKLTSDLIRHSLLTSRDATHLAGAKRLAAEVARLRIKRIWRARAIP